MRRIVLFLIALAGMSVPARALTHQVTDFRGDSSAVAGDKFRLDPDWGDSLFILPESFRYTTVKTVHLSDSIGQNGSAGASPLVSTMGTYRFKVAYLAWDNSQDPLVGPSSKDAPPPASVVTRIIDLSPDTAAVSSQAYVIAPLENTSIAPPAIATFTYPHLPPPAPSYLNFAAEGDRFAAYWGSGTPSGPVRRTTHKDSVPFAGRGKGTYVPSSTAPAHVRGFGKISATIVPGTGANKTVLAYETRFSPDEFQVRWEDIAAGTSDSLVVSTTVFPEDFAVAADSSGNAVVLWRQTADLYGMAFDNSHAQILAPTLLQSAILYADSSLDHQYRPYAVAGMTRGNFLLAYASLAAGVSDIRTRTLALPIGAQAYSLGSPVVVSGGVHYSLFPDISVSADRVVIGWYQHPVAGGSRRMMGSVFPKAGTGFTLAGRTDLDLAGENINFAGIHANWLWTHWLRSADVAVDGKGNVVAAYDSGMHAKIALIRNTPIYYDSAAFVSKTFTVANPAIPAFTFNPASDSVEFQPLRPVTTDPANTVLKLAASPTNAFGSAVYQLATVPIKAASGFYRYRTELLTTVTGNPTTTNLTTPKLKSLEIEYNVKPWAPAVDSAKRGTAPMAAFDAAAANPLLPRKDSLVLVCSGFDADDDALEFRLMLGNALLKSIPGVRTSPGNFTGTLALMPPDTVLDPLPLTLVTVDQGGWSSRPLDLSFQYRNIVPAQTLTVYRNRGRDSASVFVPTGGGIDTIAPAPGGLLVIQAGDSLTIKVRYADGNDDKLDAAWLFNSVPLGSRNLSVVDSTVFLFSPDTLSPAVDTAVVMAGDKDTTVTFRIPVRSNHLPEVDSVFHASYKDRDSVQRTGPFDVLRDFASDSGLILPAGLPTTIDGAFSDPDLTAGDSLSVSWGIWKPGSGCTQGDFTCYQRTDSAAGSALSRVFATSEEYLTVRATDAFGAFRERRIRLEYPVLDTSGASGFSAAVNSLKTAIDFVIDSDRRDTTVKAEVLSQGTADLKILSVATKADDAKWLDVALGWLNGSPPRPDSVTFAGPTNVNPITGGKTVLLPPASSLTFSFHFFSDSLRGDSVLTDTLLVVTNDFANPVLKIPFRLQHRDLPLVRLAVPGVRAADTSGGFNAAGLPSLIPARSTLAFGFTETIRISDAAKLIRVYSYLDSLKNPKGYSDIPGVFAFRRKPAGPGKRAVFLGKSAASMADSLADTVLFTPRYAKASDSLKVKPGPGFFIYRDQLRIGISNGITDLAGNALDLRLDRRVRAAGTFDTVFQALVDTSRFTVVSTNPPAGSEGWDPEGTIKVRFNRKLSRPPPSGTDSLTLLNIDGLKYADNKSIRVSSVFRTGKVYDFQFLALADNDSSLMFRTRPLLPALDTVTVILSGGILDTSGLSLDGNGDKFPGWLYDPRDTVDSYSFTFTTSEADFYIFPNPFRFSDSRHREKGSITFKNLNALRGYTGGNDVSLRIHTMTGDLVYDSEKVSDPSRHAKKLDTSLDWDLKNDHGNTVGTGVYIYLLLRDGKHLLRKGKVAVVR